jgi:hypothetical protein
MRVKLSRHLAYVSYDDGGVSIYDTSSLTNFVDLADLSDWEVTEDIAPAGDLVYFANSANGLAIFSILPELNISLFNAQYVALSWPDPAPGYMLQMSFDLTTGTWMNVTNTPYVFNGQQTAYLPRLPRAFFRLKFE